MNPRKKVQTNKKMNINKLRKRYFNYHRKQRRNRYLAAYKELKHEIEKESKRGKFVFVAILTMNTQWQQDCFLVRIRISMSE